MGAVCVGPEGGRGGVRQARLGRAHGAPVSIEAASATESLGEESLGEDVMICANGFERAQWSTSPRRYLRRGGEGEE